MNTHPTPKTSQTVAQRSPSQRAPYTLKTQGAKPRNITLSLMLSLSLLSACASSAPTASPSNRLPQRTAAKTHTSQFSKEHIAAGPNRSIALSAMNYLGTPYRNSGSTPSGFDCSGLVQYVAAHTKNLKLPRSATEQQTIGQHLNPNQIQAGDLLFFNTTGQPYSHVGIYLGETFFIHAPSKGGVVRVEDFSLPYWQSRYTGARRLP